MRVLQRREPTRIVWSDKYECYLCEKCGAVIQYNFGFKVCPYCARSIAKTDERRTTTSVVMRTWR